MKLQSLRSCKDLRIRPGNPEIHRKSTKHNGHPNGPMTWAQRFQTPRLSTAKTSKLGSMDANCPCTPLLSCSGWITTWADWNSPWSLTVTSLTRWMRATHGKNFDWCFRSPACKPTNPLYGPNNHYGQCKFVLVDTCPQQNLYAQHESSTRIHWQALILLMENIVHQLTRSIAHDLLCCMQIYLNRYIYIQ